MRHAKITKQTFPALPRDINVSTLERSAVFRYQALCNGAAEGSVHVCKRSEVVFVGNREQLEQCHHFKRGVTIQTPQITKYCTENPVIRLSHSSRTSEDTTAYKTIILMLHS